MGGPSPSTWQAEAADAVAVLPLKRPRAFTSSMSRPDSPLAFHLPPRTVREAVEPWAPAPTAISSSRVMDERSTIVRATACTPHPLRVEAPLPQAAIAADAARLLPMQLPKRQTAEAAAQRRDRSLTPSTWKSITKRS